MRVKGLLIAFRDHVLKHDRLMSLCFLITISVIGVFNLPQTLRSVYSYGSDETISAQQKTNGIQNALDENFKGKTPFINLNGLARRAMGQREMNLVYKLSNGTLYQLVYPEDTRDEAETTIAFKRELDQRGIRYMYVAAPNQINYDNASLLPMGVYDSGDSNITSFVVPLEENGVDVLDLRVAAAQQNIDLQDMFFKTDHHWLPKSGFWAFQEIVQRMKDGNSGYPESFVTNFDNYHVDTYKNVLLGSYGRRTGIFFGGLDDLDIILPDFETDVTARFLNDDGTEFATWSGSFADVFYDWDILEKDDYFNSEIYTVYGRGYPIVSVFKNPNAPCQKRALVITDSFGQVVKPFLALYFSEVYSISPFDYRTMSYLEYVDSVQPDCVIMLYSSSAFSREGFNYF